MRIELFGQNCVQDTYILYRGQMNKGPCFDLFRYMQKEERSVYNLPLILSKEDADSWLKILNEEIPFTWEFKDNYVHIHLPKEVENYAQIVLFGNLTKGVSEHAKFATVHLDDKGDLPFFRKSFTAFKYVFKNPKDYFSFNSNHYWFNRQEEEEYPLTVDTISEALKLLKKDPPVGTIFSTLRVKHESR